MSVALAILQFFVIAFICFQEARRKSPVVFLWATLMIMFGIMHPFGMLSGAAEYSPAAMDDASVFVLVFCIIYISARELSVMALNVDFGSRLAWKNLAPKCREDRGKGIALLFLIVISYMIISFASQSGGLLNTSWGGAREIAADASYINLGQLASILFFSTAGIGCFLFMRGNKALAIAMWIGILVLVLVTRNRIQILPLLVGIIALVLFRLERITIKHVVLAVVAAVLVILIVYGLRAFRYYGTLQNFFETFRLEDFIEQIAIFFRTDNGELGLRQWFYYFIEHDNDFNAFGEGNTYWRMALVFVPTQFSFGLKPDDFAQAMGAAVGLAPGGSMHPTLFGDCFANLGWGGVFLGAFWAFYATAADMVVLSFKRPSLALCSYVLIASSLVIIGRGAVYNGFFPAAWGIVFLALLAFVTRKGLFAVKTRVADHKMVDFPPNGERSAYEREV